MEPPLLRTKLYIPRPPAEDLVPRPRLTERLNDGLAHTPSITLISAPAGFGKTTLVSDWLRQLDPHVVGTWLSLDEADNDPVRFLTYFIVALQQIDPEIGQTAQCMLRVERPQPLPVASLMTTLINDIIAASIKSILILNDYHVIKSQPIHEALTFLLNNLPPEMHLIIISRTDPPLSLSRLRARGQMIELRADDLRFTVDEIASFFNTGVEFDLLPEDIALLETRTEGWIAGLQLAALSMQDQEDKSSFIAAFTGKDRYVVDYLLEEVFQRQPEKIQAFLLQTSILDRLTGALCDTVTEQNEGQEILEFLEKTNLFIVPLDNERQWYRYQHLFVEFLRGRLQQTQADLIPQLHLRAATWHKEAGLLDEAVEHTLAAQDFEQAATLIEQAVDAIMRIRGEATTFLGWLESLPDEIIHSRPRLSLDQVWALFFTGQWHKVDGRLGDVERALVHYPNNPAQGSETSSELREMRGEIAALRAELALFQENTDRALDLSEQALAYLSQKNVRTRSVITQVRGYIYRLNGDVHQASQALVEASVLSQAVDNVTTGIFALYDLAEVQVIQGQLHQAARTFQQIMDLASEHRAWPFPPTGSAYVGMGNLLREWNELETASQHLRKGIELSKQGGYGGIASQGYLTLARVMQAQGETGQVTDLLQKAEALIDTFSTHHQKARVAAVRARLWLMQGNVQAAVRWARKYEQSQHQGISTPAYQHQIEQTILARLRLAEGQPDLVRLEQLFQMAQAAGWQKNMIELLIVQALALTAQGETAGAVTALKEALNLSEPEGFIRIFVDEGAPMARLLREAILHHIFPTYVGKLQASFMPSVDQESVSPQALIDPLTGRELKVLQLMAAGLSNREIADELVLAIGTVAKYSNNIFTKLNVRNRTQAISRAKTLALI